MSDRATLRISARKQPQQARSEGLVAAILEAASQVLAQEGAQRFTTARVAEKAGVSIGSLYQYFPNKAAILFRLQRDEWCRTRDLLRDVLADESQPPLERLRTLVRAFIQSEFEEAALRTALGDAAPLYRDAPEALAERASTEDTLKHFMAVALPNAPENTRILTAEMIRTTLCAAGRRFSSGVRTAEEADRCAKAVADMFCAYLERLACEEGEVPSCVK